MSKSNIVVPEAKDALERFKMEAANEVGVNLKQGYNGDLTSKQAGSIGGQMVNVMWHVRQAEIIRNNQTCYDHMERVIYTYGLAV
nr:alpha/beta-type small acid-soluble spore protein [uncultured Ruminococcus sp.]